MKNISDSLDEIMAKLDQIEKKLSPPMWNHYCIKEGTYLSVEKDAECNWCGRTEDETNEFGGLGPNEFPDDEVDTSLKTIEVDGDWDDDRMDIIGQNGNNGEHYGKV